MNDELLPYKLYLHNDYNQMESVEHANEQGIEFANPKAEVNFDPAYEVGLECRVDPETGECFAIGLIRSDGNIMLFPERMKI